MSDIPCRGEDELRRVIGSPVEVLERAHSKMPNGLSRAEDRVAIGMRAPQDLVVQLEDEVVRRILDHRDLLEDDLALECQVARTQHGSKKNVGDDVRRLWQVLVEYACLKYGMFARGIRIKGAAECLELERNLFGASAFGTLEHHVLEQMGNSHPLGRLVHRRRTHPGAERH